MVAGAVQCRRGTDHQGKQAGGTLLPCAWRAAARTGLAGQSIVVHGHRLVSQPCNLAHVDLTDVSLPAPIDAVPARIRGEPALPKEGGCILPRITGALLPLHVHAHCCLLQLPSCTCIPPLPLDPQRPFRRLLQSFKNWSKTLKTNEDWAGYMATRNLSTELR